MKVITFGRSLGLLVAFVVAVPWALMFSASRRFGGRVPWFGVPSPTDWRWDRVQAALTDRLTEATIADLVIRVSLGVAWIAFVTVVVAVFAELAHMARHQGMPMPDIRGLAMPQRLARVIAAGLLVAIPTVGSTARAVANDTAILLPSSSQTSAHVMTFESSEPALSTVQRHSTVVVPAAVPFSVGHRTGWIESPAEAEAATSEYVVKPGDSIYGIAERLAGPGNEDIADYVDRILDLNLGRTMPDRQQFNNAAFIDVGWTLQLPVLTADGAPSGQPAEAGSHVVQENESMWEIADDELGDGQRWDEVFAANDGRTFDDGLTLTDPRLIQPGWDLVIPGPEASPVADLYIPAELPAEELSTSDPASADAPDSPTPASVPDVGTPSADATLGAVESTTAADVGLIAGDPVVLDPSTLSAAAADAGTAPDVGTSSADATLGAAESTTAADAGLITGDPVVLDPSTLSATAADAATASDIGTPSADATTGAAESTTAADAGPITGDPVVLDLSSPLVTAAVAASVPDVGTPSPDATLRAAEFVTAADAGPITNDPVVLDPSSLPTVAQLPGGTATQYPSSAANSAVVSSSVVNSWQDSSATTSGSGAGAADKGDDGLRSESSVELFTLERAAMLAGGVLLLLAARRRQQLRAARPRARVPSPPPATARTERQLRAIGGGERFARVDLAVRAAAPSLAARGSRVAAVLIAADGTLELWATGPANLEAPWRGIGDRWTLPADVSIEALATEARRVLAPAPTLVQLGVQHGTGKSSERDVYVDLETIGAVEVGGSGAQADSIVAAIASTLASSVLAEVTTLIGLGVPDEVFLGHRLHVAAQDATSAFAAATVAIGTTAHQDRSTFDLRVHATGGDTWEPAVVLVGSSVGDIPAPTNLRGLALVSGSAIIGPSSRLAPEDDAWVLRPLGLRFVPIGLTDADLVSLVALVEPTHLVEPDSKLMYALSDHTILGGYDGSVYSDEAAALSALPADALDADPHVEALAATADDETVMVPRTIDLANVQRAAQLHRSTPMQVQVQGPTADADEPLAPAILIRIIGPVTVEAIDGEAVRFERSKTKELLAWMVTHRERSTRTLARTALWDLDVRDATFANVVSEARRALARLVEPPAGEEWVGRTLTESLPLHLQVRSDADVLTDALRAARLQPPSQAIATLTPAVELIRGMPFEGASYLWPDPEGIASNLVLLATTAAAELAAHCLSIGDVEGVFAATSRGLSVLSGHEELIGLRMRAHGDAGDLAGVRMEWESYSRALLADPWSDGEPSPKLVSLRTELLSPVR